MLACLGWSNAATAGWFDDNIRRAPVTVLRSRCGSLGYASGRWTKEAETGQEADRTHPGLRQASVLKAAIEAYHEAVPHGLAGQDAMPLDTAVLAPFCGLPLRPVWCRSAYGKMELRLRNKGARSLLPYARTGLDELVHHASARGRNALKSSMLMI